MYKPEKGDYVRVVLEAVVTDTSSEKILIGGPAEGNTIYIQANHVKSVEKIQEPLKAGDCCLFWDHEKSRGVIGELVSIDTDDQECTFQSSTSDWYSHAERVPKEVADYFKTFVDDK